MKRTARFTMDENYFREDLEEMFADVLKWRKYEPWLVLGFLVSAVACELTFVSPERHVVSLLLVGIALFESVKRVRYKRAWVRARLESVKGGAEMVFVLDEEGLRQVSPPPTQEGDAELVITRRGFVIRRDGMHTYIPSASFEPPGSTEELARLIAAPKGPRV